MNKSVIICGPQGCGKSRNAKKLAKHFGLTRIMDEDGEWMVGDPIPEEDTLILTNEEVPGAIDYYDAMRQIGND